MSPQRASATTAATLVDTTVERYDFLLYGTASALIFNKQFFPTLSPTAGTLAAFATLAVGSWRGRWAGWCSGTSATGWAPVDAGGVAAADGRELDADRVVTGYASIGVWAPVLLVL
jgi:hypothetical protein